VTAILASIGQQRHVELSGVIICSNDGAACVTPLYDRRRPVIAFHPKQPSRPQVPLLDEAYH
jgi:hypothetical protein